MKPDQLITVSKTITIGGLDLPVSDAVQADILPDLADDDYRDLADLSAEHAGAQLTTYGYHLDVTRTLWIDEEQGYPTNVSVSADRTILEHLADYDTGDCDRDEWLAGWDIGFTPDAAPDDYDGPCRVWCSPNYYRGTCNAPQPAYVRTREDSCDAGDIRDFASRAEAQAYIDDYYSGPSDYDGIPQCNVLSHGQAGADTLIITVTNQWRGRSNGTD